MFISNILKRGGWGGGGGGGGYKCLQCNDELIGLKYTCTLTKE